MFVVEDGTGVTDSNSYASEGQFDTYCDVRGLTIPSGNVEAALVRASTWIDAVYGVRFSGERLMGRLQGLSWPRLLATDAAGMLVTGVPREIVAATCEAALRELAQPNSLAPDIVPLTSSGGAVRRERKKVGPLETETEYSESVSSAGIRPVFPVIDGILAGLLKRSSGYFGTAVRV